MADTAWGKQVRVTVQKAKDVALSDKVLRKIGRRQGDFIARQNRENAQKGLDRNGRKFPGYSPEYAKRRKRKGLQVGHVDLTDTHDMMNDFRTRGVGINRTGTGAVVSFFLGVSQKNEGKLKGHTTGRYGKSKKVKKRDMVGLADASTQIGKQQRKRLEEIALEEIGNEGLRLVVSQRQVGY